MRRRRICVLGCDTVRLYADLCCYHLRYRPEADLAFIRVGKEQAMWWWDGGVITCLSIYPSRYLTR